MGSVRETRVVTIRRRGSSFPPDSFAFVELYCDDKGCDWGRVMFWVVADRKKRRVANISFGFDPGEEMAGQAG